MKRLLITTLVLGNAVALSIRADLASTPSKTARSATDLTKRRRFLATLSA